MHIHNSYVQHKAPKPHAHFAEHYVQTFPQVGNNNAVRLSELDLQQKVELVKYVRSYRKPNVYGARIALKTKWNINLMKQLATSTYDRETVEFLKYGWPLNHDGRPVTISLFNHPTANRYPEHMSKYITKELQAGCLMGPFVTPPWQGLVAVSPMSTRPKKGTTKRRTIMDLSWPRNGRAVNDGIPADSYLQQPMNIKYPTVDDLCKRAAMLGKGDKGYKRDLDRAFKQLFVSPDSWPILGIFYQGAIMFDMTAVMGSRSAPYACQRTTTFIRHIMQDLTYFVLNYVDDLMGLELEHKVMTAYRTLGNLLRDLGVSEATDKAVPPSDIIEFLGILFDLVNMTISVTPARLVEIMQELKMWKHKTWYSRVQLESLIGKLQFIAKCVRPGRVMLQRLRSALTGGKSGLSMVTAEMDMDLEWWHRFLPKYKSTSIMWMKQCSEIDTVIATDACLTGMGIFAFDKYYAHKTFPEWIKGNEIYKIHHLEMWALLVALKLFTDKLHGRRFYVQVDNMIVMNVINAGKSSDGIMQAMLRELTFVAATGEFEVVTKYIRSSDNRVPDLLSRIHTKAKYKTEFNDMKQSAWIQVQVSDNMFNLDNTW